MNYLQVKFYTNFTNVVFPYKLHLCKKTEPLAGSCSYSYVASQEDYGNTGAKYQQMQ